MNRDSIAFGLPVIGVLVAEIVLIFGLLQGGMNAWTVVAGVIGLLSIALLRQAVVSVA